MDTIECLESVFRNNYLNYQVIVVDNHSPNNSLEYLKAWAEGRFNPELKQNLALKSLSSPPVKKPIEYVVYTQELAERGGDKDLKKPFNNSIIFVHADHNRGFAFGNNIGIKYALAKDDFEAVILLNPDTVISTDAISKLCYAYENNKDALFTGRILYYKNPDVIWYDGGSFNEWLATTRHLNIDKKSLIGTENPTKVSFMTFCFVLIPKKVISKIGVLDESYFMYTEDLEYSYRAKKSGFHLYHVPGSVIWHKAGSGSRRNVSPLFAYYYYKNGLKFRCTKLKGVKQIISLFYYFIRLPYSFTKWLISNPKIGKIMLRAVADQLHEMFSCEPRVIF